MPQQESLASKATKMALAALAAGTASLAWYYWDSALLQPVRLKQKLPK
jgi:hypothetical protein